jgi:hypothetical protein
MTPEQRRRLERLIEQFEAENASRPPGVLKRIICEGFLPPGIPLWAFAVETGVEFIPA